jgi:hypothetical protein
MGMIKFNDHRHVYSRNYNKQHYDPMKKKVYYLKKKLGNAVDETEYAELTDNRERYMYLVKKQTELKCSLL